MNKIIIVDDHALFARSLAVLIETFPNYKVTDIYKNGQELVDALLAGKKMPDVILLDVKMPVLNGLDTMLWLKTNKPDAKVLVISMEDDERTIIAMLKNGAKGYLLKDTNPETLKLALDTIIKNVYFHTNLTTNALLHSLMGQSHADLALDLKDNELTFIRLTCDGKTYKEIGEFMNLSIKTVDGYRQTLFDKLKVDSRIGLVVFALKNKIVSFD